MRRKFLAIPLLVALAACSDSSGPNGGGTGLGNVAVSFATQSGAAGSPAAAAYAPAPMLGDTLVSGSDTLILTSAQIVLREVELRRAEVASCVEEDACEKFAIGPVLVSLPLDENITTAFEIAIDTGNYVEVEFEIHKVSGDDPADAAFIQANPAFDDISIRVEGSFNGDAFVFVTDLNVDQELALSPAVVVDGTGGTINITIFSAVAVWFRDATGALINPATANKGEENENLVKDNIKDSFEAFEDDDRDGSPG